MIFFPIVFAILAGCESSPVGPGTDGPPIAGSGLAELPRVYLETRFIAPTGRSIIVTAGGDLQAALNGAVPGDEIVLQSGATFTGNFVLPRKSGSNWITIRSSGTAPPEGTRTRPTNAPSMARIVSPNSGSALATAPTASYYRIMNVEITYGDAVTGGGTLVAAGDDVAASLAEQAHHIIFDRVYVHGHPRVGFQRCIALNAASSAVIDSWVSECHGKGFDSQAVLAYNSGGPLKIVNNHLEGAGENVMFGGADARSADLVPQDIEFRRNFLYKPPEWNASGAWSVKNLFEIKAGVRVLIEGNVFQNNWSDAQGGESLLLKSVNQDGGFGAWSRSTDITVRNNVIRSTGAGITLAAAPEGPEVAEVLSRVHIVNNIFEDMGVASGYPGTYRMFLLLGALVDVHVEKNSAYGRFTQALIIEGVGKRNTIFRDNSVGLATYLPNTWDTDTYQVATSAIAGNIFVGSLAASMQIPGNCYVEAQDSANSCSDAGADRGAVAAATAGVVQ